MRRPVTLLFVTAAAVACAPVDETPRPVAEDKVEEPRPVVRRDAAPATPPADGPAPTDGAGPADARSIDTGAADAGAPDAGRDVQAAGDVGEQPVKLLHRSVELMVGESQQVELVDGKKVTVSL